MMKMVIARTLLFPAVPPSYFFSLLALPISTLFSSPLTPHFFTFSFWFISLRRPRVGRSVTHKEEPISHFRQFHFLPRERTTSYPRTRRTVKKQLTFPSIFLPFINAGLLVQQSYSSPVFFAKLNARTGLWKFFPDIGVCFQKCNAIRDRAWYSPAKKALPPLFSPGISMQVLGRTF